VESLGVSGPPRRSDGLAGVWEGAVPHALITPPLLRPLLVVPLAGIVNHLPLPHDLSPCLSGPGCHVGTVVCVVETLWISTVSFGSSSSAIASSSGRRLSISARTESTTWLVITASYLASDVEIPHHLASAVCVVFSYESDESFDGVGSPLVVHESLR